MSIHDFSILNTGEKAFVLWNQGTSLATRNESGYIIDLYALGTFYVEMWYDSTSKAVENIYSFKTLKRLDIYLEDINPLSFE